jgi:hypothetical protein
VQIKIAASGWFVDDTSLCHFFACRPVGRQTPNPVREGWAVTLPEHRIPARRGAENGIGKDEGPTS